MVKFASNAVSALILCGVSEGVGAFVSLKSPLQQNAMLSMVRFCFVDFCWVGTPCGFMQDSLDGESTVKIPLCQPYHGNSN
jgi:hypothetical protein